MPILKKYFIRYKISFIFIFIFLFFQVLCDLKLPDCTAGIINTIVKDKINFNFVFKNSINMLFMAITSGIASISSILISTRVACKIVKDLRVEIFEKIISFNSCELDKFGTSSLITRCTNDTNQIQNFLIMSSRMLFYAPMMAIGGIIMSSKHAKDMFWIIFLSCLVIFITIVINLFFTLPKFKLIQKLSDKINLILRENLSGLLVVRSFSKEFHEKNRFDKINKEITKMTLFVNRIMTSIMPFMFLIMNITTVSVIYVSAKNIIEDKFEIGNMLAFIQYSTQVLISFLLLSFVISILPGAIISFKRVLEILETKNIILDPIKPITNNLENFESIEFKNVSFKYEKEDKLILDNINFDVELDKITAIVGQTGSGKTTIIKLLMRFYDVNSGEILINKINIKKIKQSNLREQIGYASQKTVLFSGKIIENLKYGNDSASQKEIDDACKVSQVLNFINNSKDKFDFLISKDANNLSGGQKQRLSIARAIIKKPKILIFDDSFSALDFKTDSKIRKELKKIKNTAILIISQRISNIIDADKIIFLEKGKVAGIGTHKELLRTCKEYFKMVNSQTNNVKIL
ncbi:MAG: ABC transporter ATP-binding protein/permease [Clostridiales bacterium]|jgi:ATP-binding cassette subfamily B protein|nr:ABC transporter ATP-binding protein/permease [Clostridiales bacterium]